jgi:hypothetical protein
MTTAGSDAGIVLTLATVMIVVSAAVATRDLLVLAVGTVGLLANLPVAATRWFPKILAAPVALLVVGAVLVIVAVRTALRRPAVDGLGARRDYSSGQPTAAVTAGGAVAAWSCSS